MVRPSGVRRLVRAVAVLSVVAAVAGAFHVAGPATAGPLPPAVAAPLQGPDVPTTSAPVATIDVFTDEVFSFEEGAHVRTFAVPDVDYDRAVLVFSSRPDGDPWDRLFGVAIGGVEVLRGTTPRAEFTVRKDITQYGSLLPAGGEATASLLLSTWVGRLIGSVTIELYSDPTTAGAVRQPAAAVAAGSLWGRLTGPGTSISSSVTLPTATPTSAVVELTTSGHGTEEFWYQNGALPRVLRVLVDGVEVGRVSPNPYVYGLVGFSGAPGAVHPVMWWSAHQGLDVAGVHTGVGEIPPYRLEVAPEHLPLLTGARTLQVVQDNGHATWITSVSVLAS